MALSGTVLQEIKEEVDYVSPRPDGAKWLTNAPLMAGVDFKDENKKLIVDGIGEVVKKQEESLGPGWEVFVSVPGTSRGRLLTTDEIKNTVERGYVGVYKKPVEDPV